MKVPDKIYVSRNFSEDNSPHGLWYLNKSEHDINVEYIRKDALLEWAKEQMRVHENRILEAYLSDTQIEGARISGIKRDMYKVFIDKINSI